MGKLCSITESFYSASELIVLKGLQFITSVIRRSTTGSDND